MPRINIILPRSVGAVVVAASSAPDKLTNLDDLIECQIHE